MRRSSRTTAIDALRMAAYHPATNERPLVVPGPNELRATPLLLLAASAALAGCATAPQVPELPPVQPIVAAPPAPLASAPAPAPTARIADLTFGAAAADLEPLPIPAGDLWEHIVRGYRIPPVTGPQVEKWEAWYADRPDYVARMVERSRRYLYHVVNEIELRGMPLDLALLPMVESAYNPQAMSSARASGMWQFMPATGQTYGLKQNWWYDSRRDVLAATTSALEYLSRLEAEFGDWQLALAAYNWGEGNVRRAIARNQAKGLPTDFDSLTGVPDETRNYLPKLQAVKNIVVDPSRYGLSLADVPDAPYFAVVRTSREIDVKRAAELAEMSQEEFLSLNPQHNRPVIAGADEYALLLPIDKAEVFATKLALSRQPLVSWQAYRYRAGDTLPAVASRFGMSVETLRTVNGIGSSSYVPVGHTLLVPSQSPERGAGEALNQVVFTKVPEGRTFYYRVRRGDTLHRVAARYAVTPEELKRWNGMRSDALRAGMRLRVIGAAVPVERSARHAGRATQHARKAKDAAHEAGRDRASAGTAAAGPHRKGRDARRHAKGTSTRSAAKQTAKAGGGKAAKTARNPGTRPAEHMAQGRESGGS
jgi:membrane-bound lytic murein transglycosylase D